MSTVFARVFLLALLAAALPLRAQNTAAPGGATARAALEPVVETAKNWQADARLTNVSAVGVAPDGTAEKWDYLFYSPSAARYGLITARMEVGGEFRLKQVSRGPTEAVADDYVDSPIALATARWNGMNLRSAIMGLTSKGWAVYPSLRRGESIVWVDARSGSYIRTEQIPKK